MPDQPAAEAFDLPKVVVGGLNAFASTELLVEIRSRGLRVAAVIAYPLGRERVALDQSVNRLRLDAQGSGQLVAGVFQLTRLQGRQWLSAGAEVGKKGLRSRRRQISNDRKAAAVQYPADAGQFKLDLFNGYASGSQVRFKISEMFCQGSFAMIFEGIRKPCLVSLGFADQVGQHCLGDCLIVA